MSDEINDHLMTEEEFICVGRDEDNPGRVLCVPLKQAMNPNIKPVSLNVQGSVKDGASFGLGSSPGHNILNGSVVVCERRTESPTSYVVVGVDSATTDKETEGGDLNLEASLPALWKFLAGDGRPYYSNVLPVGMKSILGIFGSSAPSINEVSKADALRAKTVFQEVFGGLAGGDGNDIMAKIAKAGKNPLRDHKKMKTAGALPNIPKSIGGFSTLLGSIKDPTSFIKKNLGKDGEMIPNAFQMIEKLKAAGAKGSPINAAAAVGGAALVRKALAGIAQSQSQQQGTEEDEDDILCVIFKELFPDFECRIDDQMTEVFRKWKREYLAKLQDEDEPTA